MKPTLRRERNHKSSQADIAEILLCNVAVRLILLLSCIAMFAACGTSSKSDSSSGPLSGNWEFAMSAPTDGSFADFNANPTCAPSLPSTTPLPFCMSGFLVQSKSSVTGQLAYSLQQMVPPPPPPVLCAGSAQISGTASGQNVTLTVIAGTQTFSLTGALSADGSTMTGTYNSTGKGCGTPQNGLTWTATAVQPLNGNVAGNIHSTSSAIINLQDRDFPVTGFLTQGPNIGATSATVTGTLNFQNYPCLAIASVNGQISGNSVILQLIGTNGLNIGGIGWLPGATRPSPVIFKSTTTGGVIVQQRDQSNNPVSSGYGISTSKCSTGDQGNICLAFGTPIGVSGFSNVTCTQPILMSPASLSFPPQSLQSPLTAQSITLINNSPSGSTVTGLQLKLLEGTGDFNQQANFNEQDNCASSPGTSFSLGPQQSCTITVSFTPQESCPFEPTPSSCPPFLTASPGVPPSLTGRITLTLSGTPSEDGDPTFTVPVTGIGLSALQPSTPELDFGAEAPPTSSVAGEASPPQTVSFTNQGILPVQILPAMANANCGRPGFPTTLPLPLVNSNVPGLQIVSSITVLSTELIYSCDFDPADAKPNFQISNDSCSGVLLNPQQSCTLAITFTPQELFGTGLDYFLELNTSPCAAGSPACEIDSGRFPVELKANPASSLRISPAAGLDFGVQTRNQPSPPLSVTLFNDPNDPSTQTINFNGKPVTGDFSETDNCGATLSVGSSCTMSITFTPTVTGFEQGHVLIIYNNKTTPETIYMRGTGQ